MLFGVTIIYIYVYIYIYIVRAGGMYKGGGPWPSQILNFF